MIGVLFIEALEALVLEAQAQAQAQVRVRVRVLRQEVRVTKSNPFGSYNQHSSTQPNPLDRDNNKIVEVCHLNCSWN